MIPPRARDLVEVLVMILAQAVASVHQVEVAVIHVLLDVKGNVRGIVLDLVILHVRVIA